MGKRWGVWVLIVIIGWGIAIRSVNLGSHAYWVDEVHTATRIAGYTKEVITATQFNNQIQTVADYNTHQQLTHAQSLGDVLAALAQHPEHPPLYYMLVRWWLQAGQAIGVSPSVAGMRSLSVLFGILLIPAVAVLGWELSRLSPQQTNAPSDIMVGLTALSPLHILYSQEAREYSLWSIVTVLACWSLLRAIRCRTLGSWVAYGLILAVGWYSHLLFVMVAIAHSFYIIGLGWSSRWSTPKEQLPQFHVRALLIPMGSAIALSFLAFLPWIGVIFLQFSQIQTVVEATQREPAIGYLINVWGRNLSRVFLSHDLAGANFLLLVMALWSLVHLCQSRSWRVRGLILTLIGVNAAPLMVADIVTGSISSTRIRYLIPAYLGLQWAIAELLAAFIQREKPRWMRQLGQVMLVGLLIVGAIAGGTNLVQPTNWAKSDKSAYYPTMAAAINESLNPLVLTDTSATYTLTLTAQLQPDIGLLLVSRPKAVAIPPIFHDRAISDVFLFAPSPQLQRHLTQRLSAELEPVVHQNERFQLLRVSLPPYRVGEEN